MHTLSDWMSRVQKQHVKESRARSTLEYLKVATNTTAILLAQKQPFLFRYEGAHEVRFYQNF